MKNKPHENLVLHYLKAKDSVTQDQISDARDAAWVELGENDNRESWAIYCALRCVDEDDRDGAIVWLKEYKQACDEVTK